MGFNLVGARFTRARSIGSIVGLRFGRLAIFSKFRATSHGASPTGVYSIDFSSWLARTNKSHNKTRLGYKKFFRIKWGLGSKGDLEERL